MAGDCVRLLLEAAIETELAAVPGSLPLSATMVAIPWSLLLFSPSVGQRRLRSNCWE